MFWTNYIWCNLLQGEIRATAFNDAVDKFYEMLEINKVGILLEAYIFWRMLTHA